MAVRDLHDTFERVLATARAAPVSETDAALSALALVLVLDAEGVLASIGPASRSALRALAPRVLAAGAEGDDDALALGLARAGLAALGGRAVSAPASPLHPSDRALVAMRTGSPEPLLAAAVASHVRGCARCKARLRVLQVVAPAERALSEPLAAAAEAAVPMRAPSEGRGVGTRPELGVEAIVFEHEPGGAQRLAVYARDPVALRLVGAGVVTEQTAPGYWLGRIARPVARVDVTLHVERKRVTWRIDLSPRRPSRTRRRPRS